MIRSSFYFRVCKYCSIICTFYNSEFTFMGIVLELLCTYDQSCLYVRRVESTLQKYSTNGKRLSSNTTYILPLIFILFFIIWTIIFTFTAITFIYIMHFHNFLKYIEPKWIAYWLVRIGICLIRNEYILMRVFIIRLWSD